MTIEVDDQSAKRAKAMAARRGISLSQLVAEQLETLVRRGGAYERARSRSLQRLKTGYDLQWDRAKLRDEFYDR